MLFAGNNPAVNTLIGLDGDLLVDNYLRKSILPEVDYGPEVGILDSLSIAVQAGVYGMANNAINIGNYLGGDRETFDIADQLGGDLGEAYTASKDSYDLAGSIITSFIPGTLAFKGLQAMKLAQSGGIISRTVGFADIRSKRALDEVASIYTNQLSTVGVSALKRKAYGWATLDEVISGAVIGASVEVSQNLGGILVDDTLSGAEKFAKFAAPVALGSLIGAPFGGLEYLSNFRKQVTPVLQARSGILGDLSYRTLLSQNNKIVQPEYASNHMLDEFDRIEAYQPKANENLALVVGAKSQFKIQVRDQYRRYINEIASDAEFKGVANTPEHKAVTKALNSIVDNKITTPEGRASLKNLMDSVYQADVSDVTPATAAFRATDSVKQRDIAVVLETPSAKLPELATDFGGKDFKMVSLTDEVRRKGKRLKPSNKPQSAMVLNTDHPEVVNNLDKYKLLNRIIGATSVSAKSVDLEPNIVNQLNNLDGFLRGNGVDVLPEAGVFDQLAKTKQIMEQNGPYIIPTGVGRESFIRSMSGLFKAMDESKATDFLLNGTGAKWVTLADGGVTTKPAPSLYGKDLSKITKPNVINADTSLVGLMKLRLQAGKNLKDRTPEYFTDRVGGKANPVSNQLLAWVELESRTNAAIKDLDNAVPIGKDNSIDFKTAYERIREKKLEAYITLSKTHSAEDALAALGVSNIDALVSGAVVPKFPTPQYMRQIISDTGELTALKQVRLGIKSKPLSPEATLLRAAEDTDRLQQVIKMKTAASQIVRENLDDIFPTMPDLGYVEENSNIGQFLFDSHLKGDVGGVNFASVNIGDANLALRDRLKGRMVEQYNITDQQKGLVNSPDSAGELSALVHWYRQQGDKFVPFAEKDGSYALLDNKSASNYKKYVAEKEAAIEVPVSVEAWVRANPSSKTNMYSVKDSNTVSYLKSLQDMNYKEIMGPKRQIDEVYGNTVAGEEDFFYFPPRDLPFSRFFRVPSTDPLSQKSSTLYKVHGKSEVELGKEIQDAQKYFDEKGIKADMLTPDETSAQAALRLEFNWDGLELNKGRVISTQERQGAAPDQVLSNIQELNADVDSFIRRSARNISNATTELHYAEDISRIRSLTQLENKYRVVGDDTLAGQAQKLRNPGTFQTIHNQMMGRDAPHSVYNQVNNFISETMATVLQPAHDVRLMLRDKISKSGEVTRKEIIAADEAAKKALKERGLENPVGNAIESYLNQETTLTGKDINEAVAGMSYVASTMLLRLDGIDPIMNMLGATVKLSSEMKYIQEVIKRDAVVDARVQDVYAKWFGAGQAKSQQGLDISILSPAKAMATGMKDMFTPTVGADGVKSSVGLDFLKELEPLGLYKGDIKIMMELADDLVVPQGISDKASEARFLGKTRDAVKKATEYLTTPHKVSVNVAQYTALKFAADMADAAGVDLATKRMLMNGMNSRVNAISSHVSKPRLFQGLVGNAVSLYQSYFSHTIGNIIRHASSVGSGPVIRNIAMNSSIFGMQATPGFDAINAQIAYQQDRNNADLYSSTYDILPEPVADAMMYGVASAVLRANLTSRGDLTPRYMTVIPTTVPELPVMSALINTTVAVAENSYAYATGRQDFSQSVMNTVVDSKLNRPMNGVVSLIRGRSEDSRHSLVSTHDDLFSWASVVRLAGAKPMDEARVNQAYWNLQTYRAKDQARKESLAGIMKQEYAADPSVMNNPEWINSKYQGYINAGGNHRNFKRFYEQNILKASTTFEERLQVSIKDLDTARNYKAVLGID